MLLLVFDVFVILQGVCVRGVFIFGIIMIACFQALVCYSPRASLEASAAWVTGCSERVSGCDCLH